MTHSVMVCIIFFVKIFFQSLDPYAFEFIFGIFLFSFAYIIANLLCKINNDHLFVDGNYDMNEFINGFERREKKKDR